MISVLECTPAGLIGKTPTVLSTDEFSRLIQLSRLEQLTVQGLTANYIRKLARQKNAVISVTEKGSYCLIKTIQSPRGSVSLEQLDNEIVFHASRLAALVEDRQRTISFGTVLGEIEEELEGSLEEVEQVVVHPPEQTSSAEEFSLDDVFGRKE